MPRRWRTTTMDMQSVVIEVCWRPTPTDSGGDLHEVVDLHDGRVAVVIGDATGIGPDAASAAEDLRFRVRRTLRKTQEPSAVLAELDAAMEARGGDHVATLICAVLDPAARVVRVANAGHPPLIFVNNIRVELFDGVAGPPLGAPGDSRKEFAHDLAPDTAMFLYTDGLVDRPGVDTAEAIASLVEACNGIGGAAAWASEFARRATDALGQPRDDATVVSVQMAVEANRTSIDLPPPPTGRVLLRAYVDPRDMRTRSLLETLSQLETVVRDIELSVEVIDVTSKFAMTEEAGVLAAPTVLRAVPEPPVRVIGWFDSPLVLARALQLPVTPATEEGI